MNIFLDSDVVISAALSDKGAAAVLLNHNSQHINKYVSDISFYEIRRVGQRLHIDSPSIDRVLSKYHLVELDEDGELLSSQFHSYTTDSGDVHIVAGAVHSKSSFLITYNLKHFKIDVLKADYGIITLTPGVFLQYLRSKI